MIAAGFLAFFQRHLGFFALPRGLCHRFAPGFKFVALCATAGALAGCTGELSALDPAGPRAANLATLWWVMFWGAAALFALVMVLFFLAYIRSDLVARLKPAHWIIGGGLVLPIPILVLLTGTALVLGDQLLPRGQELLQIGAHASRWDWTFTYPDGRTSPDEVLHIPAGEPVDFIITAEDVIHSFWIPRLGGKIDAIPGHTNIIRLEADRPGTYWGQCAEYCGEGHDVMFFQVVAHEPDAFAALMGGAEE
jgi:cytochrome c oxidase subunit 2